MKTLAKASRLRVVGLRSLGSKCRVFGLQYSLKETAKATDYLGAGQLLFPSPITNKNCPLHESKALSLEAPKPSPNPLVDASFIKTLNPKPWELLVKKTLQLLVRQVSYEKITRSSEDFDKQVKGLLKFWFDGLSPGCTFWALEV